MDAPTSAVDPRMDADLQPLGPVTRKEVLAASSPWVAASLNLLPGLGTGYIYQRRWGAYWITALSGALWLAVANFGPEALDNPLPELLGLSLLSAGEAFLAARRARMD
ncbi:MAG: hypothetical protein VKK99_06940 [Cyanobacteriota bacterium]|nr:hypothetical protein [Cyanobacteriota bacterium]